MAFLDIMITFSVLLGIFIIVYSKMRDQGLKDTLDEIKDMINPTSITPGRLP